MDRTPTDRGGQSAGEGHHAGSTGLDRASLARVHPRTSVRAHRDPYGRDLAGVAVVAALIALVMVGRPIGLVGAATGSPAGAVVPISITVTPNVAQVTSGAVATLDVAIRNRGSDPVTLAVDECGAAATMSARIGLPIAATGRSWDGTAGAFKKFLFAQGHGPGGAPVAAPLSVPATATDCVDRPGGLVLAPGDTSHVALTWKAELADGLAAPSSVMPYAVTVEYVTGLREAGNDPFAGGPADTRQATTTGTLQVSGDAKPLLSAGDAVDALLADPRFIDWLGTQPQSTWSTANLVLSRGGTGEGMAPKGASWEIDLFRERDAPRTWAIGFVDPSSGAVESLTFCNAPCDH